MEEGFANILADELKATILSIKAVTKDMFKNTRPFRSVKRTKMDVVADYMARKAVTTPEEIEVYRQTMPGYDQYEREMEGMGYDTRRRV